MAEAANLRKPVLRRTSIVVLCIIIPIAFLVVRWTRNAQFIDLNDRAQDELKVQLAYLQSQMDNLYVITRIVGTDARVLSLLERPDDSRRQVAANHFLARYDVTAGSLAYVLNTQGKVLASGNWEEPDSFIGRKLGLRPYFKASAKGETAQYIAISATNKRLGFYVSTPIRLSKGRVAGVAVTQTDPQDLMLPHERPGRPFLITDAGGVIIISNPKEYLFRSLVPLRDDQKEQSRNQLQLSDVDIHPLSTRPIESRDKIKLITFSEVVESGVAPASRQYVLADAPIASFGWRAYMLWPVENLNATLIQRLMITLLVLIITWLLTLYAVERWRHMKLLHEQAICDPLTQLFTRLYMLRSATQLLAAHDRQSIPGVSAIMFDLDRFKSINDRYGHRAGDNVLVQVAGVVKKECRHSDIPIRYGGEEILVFVPTGDLRQALQLAERIRQQIKNLRMRLSGKPVHITISGGIATHLPGESLEKLIDRADQMMYQAKQNGRDQIRFNPSESG